jgi:hypothetical protein
LSLLTTLDLSGVLWRNYETRFISMGNCDVDATTLREVLIKMSRKIITKYVHPPIPIRQFDWVAFREGADELRAALAGSGE